MPKVPLGLGRNRDYSPGAGRVLFPANGLGNASATHQPDQYEAEHSRHDTGHAQRSFRTFDCGGSQALGGSRERRKKQALDDQHQTDCDKKLSHIQRTAPPPRRTRDYLVGGLVGGGAGGGEPLWRFLPEGSTKNLKNSESGLSSMRVSLERKPAS
jgi:hypothetical protein